MCFCPYLDKTRWVKGVFCAATRVCVCVSAMPEEGRERLGSVDSLPGLKSLSTVLIGLYAWRSEHELSQVHTGLHWLLPPKLHLCSSTGYV